MLHSTMASNLLLEEQELEDYKELEELTGMRPSPSQVHGKRAAPQYSKARIQQYVEL